MMQNLDLECAKLGRELAELKSDGKLVEEKVFTAALGVLEEQGPYACFLYLQAREDKLGRAIAKKAAEFLVTIIKVRNSGQDPLQVVQNFAENVDQLLCDN
ncbi:MAG TPA: hypothetical protein VNL96_02335 [Gemmatimonadaceae bacterium]|nr:hypothetical protein [Gemmatimonadaceae bacterium]